MKSCMAPCGILAALALACFQMPAASAGVIVNEDFSTSVIGPDPFPGWSTSPFAFVPPGDGGGFASFSVTGFFDDPQQLEQLFLLPSNATTLSFEIQLTSVAGGVVWPFATNDSFQASLFDTLGNPQFPTSFGIFDAFYSVDSSGFEGFSSAASVEDIAGGLKRVTLNLATLPSQDYVIEFAMLGDDDGLQTTVGLDNVIVAQAAHVVPEPASIALWAIFGITALPMSRRRQKSQLAA